MTTFGGQNYDLFAFASACAPSRDRCAAVLGLGASGTALNLVAGLSSGNSHERLVTIVTVCVTGFNFRGILFLALTSWASPTTARLLTLGSCLDCFHLKRTDLNSIETSA